jgi:hypothetical protein
MLNCNNHPDSVSVIKSDHFLCKAVTHIVIDKHHLLVPAFASSPLQSRNDCLRARIGQLCYEKLSDLLQLRSASWAILTANIDSFCKFSTHSTRLFMIFLILRS